MQHKCTSSLSNPSALSLALSKATFLRTTHLDRRDAVIVLMLWTTVISLHEKFISVSWISDLLLLREPSQILHLSALYVCSSSLHFAPQLPTYPTKNPSSPVLSVESISPTLPH